MVQRNQAFMTILYPFLLRVFFFFYFIWVQFFIIKLLSKHFNRFFFAQDHRWIALFKNYFAIIRIISAAAYSYDRPSKNIMLIVQNLLFKYLHHMFLIIQRFFWIIFRSDYNILHFLFNLFIQIVYLSFDRLIVLNIFLLLFIF